MLGYAGGPTLMLRVRVGRNGEDEMDDEVYDLRYPHLSRRSVPSLDDEICRVHCRWRLKVGDWTAEVVLGAAQVKVL